MTENIHKVKIKAKKEKIPQNVEPQKDLLKQVVLCYMVDMSIVAPMSYGIA